MKVSIDNVGSIGIIKDLRDYSVALEAWTSGANVQFSDNAVGSFSGYEVVLATPLHTSTFLISGLVGQEAYWVYAGDTAVGATALGTHADITRASGGAYNSSVTAPWSGDLLHGLVVLNNKNDVPQYWPDLSLSLPLLPFPAWPAGYKTNYIVTFKNYILALGLTKSGSPFPHTVLWSDIADPGSMPTSWDIADPTKNAGEHSLVDINSGGLVAGKVLGNSLILYKENSIWVVSLSGDNFIFRFDSLFPDIGLKAPRAVALIPQKREHLFFSGSDLMVHNGSSVKSILQSRERRNLLAAIDTTNFINSFMTINEVKQEVWFCYPSQGHIYPNKILAYNYESGVVSHRELPDSPYIAVGVISESSGTVWNSVAGTWNAAAGTWGSSSALSSLTEQMLMTKIGSVNLYKMESGEEEEGVKVSSFLEKKGIAVARYSARGVPVVDTNARKVLSRISLKLTGGPVTIRALVQESLDGPITYSAAMVFDPAVGQKYVDLPTPLSGLYYGMRIESADTGTWKLHSYEIEMEAVGGAIDEL